MMSAMTRWQRESVPRGDSYDERWRTLAAAGENVHGEADLVTHLLGASGGQVLDAGCGTGRVAIELARRGMAVEGVDADAEMLATAKDKAPEMIWHHGDLATIGEAVPGPFDLILLAGNVMIFLDPGTEQTVLANCARRLAPGGLLVAGFSLRPDRLTLAEYDGKTSASGLRLQNRWATWDREAYADGDYAVSVHGVVSVHAP